MDAELAKITDQDREYAANLISDFLETEGDEIHEVMAQWVRKIRLALARGHKDPDAEIVCVGGRREPVWKFYRDQAVDDLVWC